MNFHTPFLVLLLHIYIFPTAAAAVDLILLNCGASTILNDTVDRTWAGDDRSGFRPANAAAISSAYTATRLEQSVSPIPYQTARVFNYSFTYTFPISRGQKFLRLYFYPGVYSGYNASQSIFSVLANSFPLLKNFSPLIYSQNSSQPSFMKEFVINIDDNSDKLVLTFFPEPYSFAFVNGVEIVSIPDELYFRGKDVPIKYVEENSQLYFLDLNSALEILYRLNVGGWEVDIREDSMFRAWSADDGYLVGASHDTTSTANSSRRRAENVDLRYSNGTPPYTAPVTVYTSARVTSRSNTILTWEFPVDSGFNYLLRLHFCEFTPGVIKSRQRVFTIVINNVAAEPKADVVSWAGGPLTPTFKDYIAWVPDYGGRGKQILGLSLYADSGGDPNYGNALLNGLEIFKLNDSHGILTAGNPEFTVPTTTTEATVRPKEERSGLVIYAATGSVIGFLAVFGVSSFLIYRKLVVRKKASFAKSSWQSLSNMLTSTGTGDSSRSHPSKLCRCFSLAEIRTATSNLDRSYIVGKGGFGHVYRGIIDNDGAATTVAIKRLNPSSNQGAREFLTEIHMLSMLRHLHLVSLIGYCDEEGEMILVYDYMARGSLRDHLYNTDNPPLTWKQRLRICMGAAKGLHYLHTGTQHSIIHRDVKSTNILLDDNWVAKISDFGLSKMGEANDSFTHISTNVKGTFGYLDPKYLSTHQLTRKSDVYAFGVVMFEVLSGRPAVDVRLDEEEQHSLAGWARSCVREGEVVRLVDPNLAGQISTACLEVFVGIGGRSIHIQPSERPTMADVVMGLELALALQENTEVEELG